MGDDIDGLGGFVLESKDGSMVLDYRFDSRLEAAWRASLGTVNASLFGE
jgi:vacuolar-type H+-ATPase subunit E/Vma4